MAVTDTGDIIKVDFESGDTYGDSYDNRLNRYRVWEAIGDETIMEKKGNIYFLYNRALHIGTENSNTYFFDDDGGALIWQGTIDTPYFFINEGYIKFILTKFINE